MCFVKSKAPAEVETVVQQEAVQRKEADAATTKASKPMSTSGYNQNVKTSAYGLLDAAPTEKKTLLGE